eukprot:3031763-Rhodomonas_salina.1
MLGGQAARGAGEGSSSSSSAAEGRRSGEEGSLSTRLSAAKSNANQRCPVQFAPGARSNAFDFAVWLACAVRPLSVEGQRPQGPGQSRK